MEINLWEKGKVLKPPLRKEEIIIHLRGAEGGGDRGANEPEVSEKDTEDR